MAVWCSGLNVGPYRRSFSTPVLFTVFIILRRPDYYLDDGSAER